MIDKHVNGTTKSPNLVDGAEMETDKDFEPGDPGLWLTLTAASGEVFDFYGPEADEAPGGLMVEGQHRSSLMPEIEKLAPRHFRLRLTEIQERYLRRPV